MSCQARILDQEFTVGDAICHTTKECGNPFFKKISIDNGDASMKICPKCFSRFMSKGTSKTTWYGWFDCEFPPEAHIKYSAWWRLKIREDVEKKLEEINTWLKGEGKTNYKEQPAKIREAMKLRAQLK